MTTIGAQAPGGVPVETSSLHILIGWGGMLFGALSGAVLGLFFHRDGWAGGYGSFRRRMLRLGHISFFGIGFLNLFFALSIPAIDIQPTYLATASVGLATAAVAMPAVCFLTAWRAPFRHLFPVPVLGVMAGIVSVLVGGFAS